MILVEITKMVCREKDRDRQRDRGNEGVIFNVSLLYASLNSNVLAKYL